MPPQLLDQRRPPHDDPGLWPAQQLVAREHHQVRPGRQALLRRRLGREAVARRVEQAAAADVVEQQQAVLAGDAAQLAQAGLRREAHDLEVAGVHAQQRRRRLGHRVGVVAGAGAVRRADLDQPRAALAADVGDAEAPADLDRLPPADDHVPLPREGRQHEQQRRRVVVHRQPRLRPRRRAQQRVEVAQPRAPPPRFEVVLQVRVAPPGLGHRRDRRGRQRRPPQVGVQDDPGGVDRRPQRRSRRRLDPFHDRRRDRLDAGHVRPLLTGPLLTGALLTGNGLPRRLDRRPRVGGHEGVGEARPQPAHGLLPEHAIDAG